MSYERRRNGEYISLSFLEEMHAEHYQHSTQAINNPTVSIQLRTFRKQVAHQHVPTHQKDSLLQQRVLQPISQQGEAEDHR